MEGPTSPIIRSVSEATPPPPPCLHLAISLSCSRCNNVPKITTTSGTTHLGHLVPTLGGSTSSNLQERLEKRVPVTFKETTYSTYDYLRSRETVALTRGITRGKAGGAPSGNQREERRETRRDDRHHRREERNPRRFHPFDRAQADIPLSKTPQEILQSEKVSNTFRPPLQMNPTRFGGKNSNKYCHFHEDHGHDTNACRELKSEIRRALEDGKLSHLVSGAKAQVAANPDRKAYSWQSKDKEKVDHPGQPDGHIYLIQDY